MYISKFNRDRYDSFLDDPRNPLARFINGFIFTTLIIFLIAFIMESVWDYATIYKKEFFYLDAFVSIIFAAEYIFRLFHSTNKISFFGSPTRAIDLFSFLPFFLWFASTSADVIKILRFFRVFRVLRLIRKIPLTAGFIKSLKEYKEEYSAVFLLFFIVLLIGSVCVYYFESTVTWTKFSSVPMALWWGLVTMTTVGYGDMYPVTTMWRVFWSVLVFVGPLLLALSSAVTIMVFAETSRNQALHTAGKKKCHRCEDLNPHEANYCMKCWEKVWLE